MNILITGASGFIGKNLSEYFSKKYHLFTPTHKQLNLLDEQSVKKYFLLHSVDIVIHCAVIGGSRIEENKKEMFYDNLRMFFNLVQSKKLYKRMIQIGSGAAYDKQFPIVKVKEEDFGRRIPDDGYGFYKYVCSSYIQNTSNILDLRVFGLFGEWEDYHYRFISNAICRQLSEMQIKMSKNVVFDYVDIRDFMRIIDYFIKHVPKHKAYNVGSGNTYSLLDLAKKIQLLSSGKKQKIIVQQKGLNKEYTCDSTLLRKEVGLRFTSIDESIQRLYKWYSSHKNNIDIRTL
jgi:nucleoside-diphosphate-sugar epimerase